MIEGNSRLFYAKIAGLRPPMLLIERSRLLPEPWPSLHLSIARRRDNAYALEGDARKTSRL